MDYVGDEPYVSYLNKNFANRGINIIFTTGCIAIKENKAILKDRMALQDDSIDCISTNVKVFQLHRTDTNWPVCGPTMQRCHDWSCRAQPIVFALDSECAPSICACMVGNQFS